jgi:RNA polymerase sigma factor (TIGR02999 family)
MDEDPIIAGLSPGNASSGGHGEAMHAVYEDLRRIARAELGRHRRGQTLNTAALVNEAYLKLYGQHAPSFENRRHFYATAARAMRQVVIDYARSRLADMRGGGAEHLSLDDLDARNLPVEAQAENLVRMDAALARLACLDPRLAEVVELRFFAGLEVSDVAELLGVSAPTVKRDTRTARAFLAKELGDAGR